MRRLGLLILLFISAVYGGVTAHVTLERVGPYVVVGDVRVNGEGPFRFLVDTGATSCTVSEEVAARLSVRPEWRVELERSARPGELEVVGAAAVRSLSVGGVERTRIEVLIGGSMADVVRAVPGVDGILGQSFLREVGAYVIDNRAGVLVLEPERTSVRGRPVPFELQHNRPVVRERSREWVLDSGAPRDIALDRGRGLLATAAFEAVYVNNRQRFVVLQGRR